MARNSQVSTPSVPGAASRLRTSSSLWSASAQSVCCMTAISATPRNRVASTSDRSTSGVTRPPALRRILASPGCSPSMVSGSMRLSMQVTRAKPRAATGAMPSRANPSAYSALALEQGVEHGTCMVGGPDGARAGRPDRPQVAWPAARGARRGAAPIGEPPGDGAAGRGTEDVHRAGPGQPDRRPHRLQPGPGAAHGHRPRGHRHVPTDGRRTGSGSRRTPTRTNCRVPGRHRPRCRRRRWSRPGPAWSPRWSSLARPESGGRSTSPPRCPAGRGSRRAPHSPWPWPTCSGSTATRWSSPACAGPPSTGSACPSGSWTRWCAPGDGPGTRSDRLRHPGHPARPGPGRGRVHRGRSGQRRDLRASAYATRVAECEAAAAVIGPLGLAGAADLAGLRDPVLRRRARHVTTECARVGAFADALSRVDLGGGRASDGREPRSLAEDFEASTPELDALVADVRSRPGVLGARMTGAGFGGCVVVLGEPGALDPTDLGRPAWRVTPSDGTVARRGDGTGGEGRRAVPGRSAGGRGAGGRSPVTLRPAGLDRRPASRRPSTPPEQASTCAPRRPCG